MSTPTHLSSGSVVVSVDELTTDDLAHLLDLKRSEPERRRAIEDEELGRSIWRLLDSMPCDVAAEVAADLDELHPGIVLQRHFPEILLAKYGAASVAVWGYSASVAA